MLLSQSGLPSPPCPAYPNPFHVPKLNSGELCPGSLPARLPVPVVPSQATASPSWSGLSKGLGQCKPGHCPADHHTAQLIPTRTLDTSTAELVSFPLGAADTETQKRTVAYYSVQNYSPSMTSSQDFRIAGVPSLPWSYALTSIHPNFLIQSSPLPFLYLSGGHTGNGMESKH